MTSRYRTPVWPPQARWSAASVAVSTNMPRSHRTTGYSACTGTRIACKTYRATGESRDNAIVQPDVALGASPGQRAAHRRAHCPRLRATSPSIRLHVIASLRIVTMLVPIGPLCAGSGNSVTICEQDRTEYRGIAGRVRLSPEVVEFRHPEPPDLDNAAHMGHIAPQAHALMLDCRLSLPRQLGVSMVSSGDQALGSRSLNRCPSVG
jgi:hypothetical protein